MPRRKVKVKFRTGKLREPWQPLFQLRRFLRERGYYLLMGGACIVAVVILWIMIGRIKPTPPTE